MDLPFCSTPLSPSTNDKSMSAEGCASRCFITGRSECPPARSFASGVRARRPAACRTVVGRWKVKLYISNLLQLRGLARLSIFERCPNRLCGCRHDEILTADRVSDGIDHGGRCRNRSGLSAPFDAKRIRRRLRFSKANLERGQVVRMRHAIIHQRPGHELTVFIVHRALQQSLPDALRDAAMHLPFDNHWIDDRAEIVDGGPIHDFSLAGLAVDLDFANVAAGRECEVCRVVEAGFLQSGLKLLPRKFVCD